MAIPRRILSVIGSGGMGLASARRLAGGRRVLLADYSQNNLDFAAKSLRDDGHEVETHVVDISDFPSVREFAVATANAGNIDAIVHTAGLSPGMAPAKRIYEVDLLGTANVIDAFHEVIPAGASLTCIASIARFGATPSPELAAHLATAARDQLLNRKELLDIDASDPATAYSVSKCANFLRVRAAARAYAAKGARINTVSPGAILTAMLRQELEGASAGHINHMIVTSPMQRGGTANEIASVVGFLAGPDASFITGSDIVVDGGCIAGNQGLLGPAAPKTT
ncbi:putative oxidoreductase YxbG [Madurella mycetomatis]|uniref:Oxidoreductase YxbG n=1 Tax=Madurella mycetomatis TaxID=100816 RepID=A0A175W6Z3_9PEZI|nr:putative oxidoreductase YxbG [Madurella mycetomatis]